MRRCVPHVHFGSASTECVDDEEDGGREGRYFEICWFGWMLSFSVSSSRWHHQDMARIHAKYGDLPAAGRAP